MDDFYEVTPRGGVSTSVEQPIAFIWVARYDPCHFVRGLLALRYAP